MQSCLSKYEAQVTYEANRGYGADGAVPVIARATRTPSSAAETMPPA
jgi:hypothetical protein